MQADMYRYNYSVCMSCGVLHQACLISGSPGVVLVCAFFVLFPARRHRTEISKIPMYADSILKMLKDIRKTVRSSAKLQPGSNAFAQFLEEVSVIQLYRTVARVLRHFCLLSVRFESGLSLLFSVDTFLGGSSGFVTRRSMFCGEVS